MQKEELRFADSTVLEGMVSIRALIAARAEGHNDRRIQKVLYTAEHAKKHPKEISFLCHEGERSGFTVQSISEEEISSLTVGSTHGGLIAVCGERTLPPLPSLTSDIKSQGFYVMIEGIEDPYNFGYALRSLYALGVDGVILPPRSWMSAAGVVARSSAGASERFKLYTATAEEALTFFKAQGYTTVAADLHTEMTIEETPLPYPIFLLVGGEKRGISAKALQSVDTVVKISYGRDFAASLSAASATTILAYEIAKQNRK